MKPWIKAPGSLRLNLMAWLAVPVAVILAASAWLSYGSAMRQATLVTDRQLVASARTIAEQITYANGSVNVVIPPSALEIFSSDSHDEVAYAVIGDDNKLVAGFPSLGVPPETPPDFERRFFETSFRTKAMRAVILRQPVITPGGGISVSVVVGETQKARNEMARGLWIRGFMEEAVLVLAAVLSIWIGVNRELRPLLHLRKAVLNRPADRLEPFDCAPIQSEVRPLVEALNTHMRRLDRQLTRQRRFLDSAAHQLRTPLAIMKTQVGYARRTPETSKNGATLKEIDANLTAMSRLTKQLLTLGRVEHDRESVQSEIIDFSRVVRAVVAEAAPRALDAQIDLVFETEGGCPVAATTTLAREMIYNLIDNVIEHAGAGTTAKISVRRTAGMATMTVEDNGRGDDGDTPSSLFERFRRGSKARSGGSGLGLAIVAEITGIFSGSVAIQSPRGNKGFCITVRLPLDERTAK